MHMPVVNMVAPVILNRGMPKDVKPRAIFFFWINKLNNVALNIVTNVVDNIIPPIPSDFTKIIFIKILIATEHIATMKGVFESSNA